MAVKTYYASGITDGGYSSTYNVTEDTISDSVDDNGYSKALMKSTVTSANITSSANSSLMNYLKHTHNIYKRNEIDIFNKRYRFGLFNPYDALSTTREFLFFTKPDLNIYTRTSAGALDGGVNEGISSLPYWTDLLYRYDDVISCLQSSYSTSSGIACPYNQLLANMCISNLSVPSLSADTIETPSNPYGVNFTYRGSSESSNDGFDFDLEFKDTKYLHVYQFFKAYEEYETLKHHGTVGPWKGYIQDKVLHDQFAIYKFLVDEDMETIVYWCKFYGVFPTSLPRDVFSSADFESGLSYSISFKCAFFDDMDPLILNDFNTLSNSYYKSRKYRVDIFNGYTDRIDNRAVKAAYVVSDTESPAATYYAPGQKLYKLKWRGDDQY